MATAHRQCFCQRRRSYKQMVQDIADNLGSEDVQKIVFLHDLPTEYSNKSALAALRRLEMQGQFSESETERLESLLEGIHRFDLINRHVVQYRKNYCDCENSSRVRGPSPPVPIPPNTSSSPHAPSLKPLPPTPSSLTTSHDSKHSGSTRLKPEEKQEIRHLLTQYVPRDVISLSSSLLDKFSLRRTWQRASSSYRSVGNLSESHTERDGPADLSRSAPHKAHRKVTTAPLPAAAEKTSEELEWVVLEAHSMTADSGTCSGSSSSLDDSFDIGDLCTPARDKSGKKAKTKKSGEKERRYFTWRIRRSEFMIPLFEHTHKTFEKTIKLCMGPRGPCLPITFKLFPNGVGSDENIYSTLRIVLPSASQMVPMGTSLVFSITVRDLCTADILATRHMEVAMEREEFMLEQFLAHEVIKSSQARHMEIRVMTKINTSPKGWVEIQTNKN